MNRNILQNSFRSAYFSIIFQILCRLFTFGINAYIIRNIGRNVLGVINVRLLLLESTLLFLSREAINRATLSATTQQKSKCTWAQTINQIWLTVPICIAISVPCLYIWFNILSSVDDNLLDQYYFSAYAVVISCIIELLAETPVFFAKVFCFIKLKVALDTLHILVRSILFLYLIKDNKDICIYAFGIAQLSSAITIVIGYYGFFMVFINKNAAPKKKREFHSFKDFPFNKLKDMLPGQLLDKETYLNSDMQILTISFLKQGAIKQILTEGEKYVMSISPVLSFSDQATYDIVNNLGSLAARYIFRPIEDSSYFYFTQTISRDIKLELQDKEKTKEASFVLSSLCLVFTSIGLTILVFGQNFSGIALYLYGGEEFISDGLSVNLLQWHCLAILFLAVNGITEGFMFATNESFEIDKYNYYMAIFSLSFLVLSYLLTNIMGPAGFVVANCLNMFCRICYSTTYITHKFSFIGVNPVTGIFLGRVFCGTLLFTGVICKIFVISYNKDLLLSICIGVLCFGVCVIIWVIENKNIVRKLIKKLSST